MSGNRCTTTISKYNNLIFSIILKEGYIYLRRNINSEKLTLLKMQGVTQIDIFFDPDDAGLDAQNRVIELCESVGLLHYGIKIRKELGDAGALTHEHVKRLKERLYG